MSVNDQIGLYASVILVMLTLMRMISGITGSKSVKDAVLLSAVISFVALVGAGGARFFLEFSFFRNFVTEYRSIAENISLAWQIIWFGLISYHFGLGVLFRLYVRSTRFKDWGTFANLRVIPIAKHFREWKRRKAGDKKGYETNSPENVSDEKTISTFKKFFGDKFGYRRPVLVSGSSPWDIREKVVDLLVALMKETEEEFNYVCCTISPANIWQLIEDRHSDADLQSKLKRRLVIVDAYTDTFGFGDEILTDRVEKMRAEKHIELVSCSSAAGVHKGTTAAFKILKKFAKDDRRQRGTCTVIYDGLSSLAIPETETEVSEFIIHLAAAEHTYDMQTVFIEADVDHRGSMSLDAIRACCGSPIIITEGES